MAKRVQIVKSAPRSLMYEGVLEPDINEQMIARSKRGQPFQQILISAEARSRVELWREYTAPVGVDLLVQHRSPPLAAILMDMNKYSNNFMAELVLRTAGAGHELRVVLRPPLEHLVGAVEEEQLHRDARVAQAQQQLGELLEQGAPARVDHQRGLPD